MKKYLFAFLICLPAWGSLFDRLQRSFAAAELPEASQIEGYWGGHCVHSHQPEAIWPSFYGHQTTDYSTQFYYVENSLDANRFLTYTPKKIEEEPSLKQWRETVELSPVQVRFGAFVNFFSWPGFPRLARESRYISTDQRNWVVLRISAADFPNQRPYSMCYYSNRLSSTVTPYPVNPPIPVEPMPTPVPTPTPTPSPIVSPTPIPKPTPIPTPTPIPSEKYLMGDTGSLQNARHRMKNQVPDEEFSYLVFLHIGNQSIRLNHLKFSIDGASLGFGSQVTLEPGVPLEVSIGMRTKIEALSFEIIGSTQNIRVRGVKSQ